MGIKLIDSTLREGSQSTGVYFEIEEIRNIASMLDSFGVDCIEVGHPYCNIYEMEKTKAVTSLPLNALVLAHSRARISDVTAVKESGASWIGIFTGINPISLKNKFNSSSTDKIIERITESISYAKILGLKVRFTLEDASRTAPELKIKAFKTAIDAGADRICYSDTVGVLNTEQAKEELSHIRTHFPDIDIEVHFHDDRGLALANALSVKPYINWISCSVNGIGERCGITDTLALKANIMYENGKPWTVKETEKARLLSKMINAYSRSNRDERSPIVGKHAFTHCADLHIKAFEKDLNAYCWIRDYEGQKAYRNDRKTPEMYVNSNPKVISATELKYHRKGPGNRYVMMDSRIAANVKQYCIVREIDVYCNDYPSYVDTHVHHCDSLFIFLGDQLHYKGLQVAVELDNKEFILDSPASVFIPSGKKHSYRVIKGKGSFVNHVLSENYNESLLELPVLTEEKEKLIINNI